MRQTWDGGFRTRSTEIQLCNVPCHRDVSRRTFRPYTIELPSLRGAASTLILIFLGTLMSRSLYQRQLSDSIQKILSLNFWNNLISVRGFPAPSCFTSIFQSTVLSWNWNMQVHVWHHLLTKTQTDSIESVQKRAFHIIYSFSNDISHIVTLSQIFSAYPLEETNSLVFFLNSIVHPTSSLHSLLPWDPDLLACLRAPTKFSRIPTRTKKYQSFVSYALSRIKHRLIFASNRLYTPSPIATFISNVHVVV